MKGRRDRHTVEGRGGKAKEGGGCDYSRRGVRPVPARGLLDREPVSLQGQEGKRERGKATTGLPRLSVAQGQQQLGRAGRHWQTGRYCVARFAAALSEPFSAASLLCRVSGLPACPPGELASWQPNKTRAVLLCALQQSFVSKYKHTRRCDH